MWRSLHIVSKCIDFILSYTGITQERAHIVQGYYVLPDWWGEDEYDGIMVSQEECIEYPREQGLIWEWSMGQKISIEFMGARWRENWVTMGHPIDSSGRHFLTSIHRGFQFEGRRVFAYGTDIVIGRIVESRNVEHIDYAIIELNESHSISPYIYGTPISEYRAAARAGDRVLAIRASGIYIHHVSSPQIYPAQLGVLRLIIR